MKQDKLTPYRTFFTISVAAFDFTRTLTKATGKEREEGAMEALHRDALQRIQDYDNSGGDIDKVVAEVTAMTYRMEAQAAMIKAGKTPPDKTLWGTPIKPNHEPGGIVTGHFPDAKWPKEPWVNMARIKTEPGEFCGDDGKAINWKKHFPDGITDKDLEYNFSEELKGILDDLNRMKQEEE